MSITIIFALLTPAPTDMSSGTADHDAAAMAHVERGDFEAAYTEFSAAYAALPDAAGDRDAREAVMGSLRSVLLRLYAADRSNPEPLCRLRMRLRAHIDALVVAYPDRPDLLEIRGNQERLAAVDRDLVPFGAGACEVAPVDAKASDAEASDVQAKVETSKVTDTATASPTRAVEGPWVGPGPSPGPSRTVEAIPARHLRIAGGVTLGVAAAALGIMAWRIADEGGLAAGATRSARPLRVDRSTPTSKTRSATFAAKREPAATRRSGPVSQRRACPRSASVC